jgi:hypothetical protein
VSPLLLDRLIAHLHKRKSITYHAINFEKKYRTNSASKGVSALTWG